MQNAAQKLVREIGNDAQLRAYAMRLAGWLVADLNQSEEPVPDFAESRARALLRATAVADDPLLTDLVQLLETSAGARIALFDLLDSSGVGERDDVQALATVAAASAEAGNRPYGWLSLAVAAFAWQRDYPLYQLDPGSPPEPYSPAGQIVARAGHWARRQVTRSASDRERLAARLAPRSTGEGPASQEALRDEGSIAPLPPHFRPPVPVAYPEVARETLQVDDTEDDPSPEARGQPLVITEEDLEESDSSAGPPMDASPLSISPDQVVGPNPPAPLPSSGVVMPASAESRAGLTVALRQMFRSETLDTTQLRVVVQEYPDGPGVYGLQVRIRCKGIKSYVAGTTDRDGRFVAELPVRLDEGLTYDVDVTWPREMGGDIERKSLTLNSERPTFTLPFYRRLTPGGRLTAGDGTRS